jgi:catechol 2,3-dioxygenase-like lactoylglutathione lyase family enzyme
MNALRLAALAIDCTDDPAGLARWWQGLIGGEVDVDEEGDASLEAPGFPRLDFLRVPDGKESKNRLHLDFYATGEFDAAVEAALAHGATKAEDIYAGRGWQVFRDPQGNEFCILWPPTGNPG